MAWDTREVQKHKAFLDIAKRLGELGTCDRAHVGAVIVRDGRCVSWGYNGAPPGMPHCGEGHGWLGQIPEGLFEPKNRSWINEWIDHQGGCINATHAEANALAFAARQGISTDGATLYVTVAPCEVCARLLIAAGIVTVVYDELYRDDSGVKLLEGAGVMVGGLSG